MLEWPMRVRDSELAEKSVTRFFDALRDVFVGAKVEGESGYINLRRIKLRYLSVGVFPKLQRGPQLLDASDGKTASKA